VGRTGKLWAYQHSGVEPDVMTLAKALANGIPIGAMLCREHVAQALTAGTHGSTFAGSAFVTSVALATLTIIIGEKIPDKAAARGRELVDGLRALQKKHPVITQVRGQGLLIGVELTKPAAPVLDACREQGLLLLSAGEKVVRLAPPLIVEAADCAKALAILGDVLAKGGA
jgi:acetylornithine aminotransferase